ncbi:MAG: hypothetical protein HRT47_11365 [Candidatus Caenarcaniphilales bacterium]|nr:hypothetical protein [Candidatus Caenarcaniphilales bacterium]
MALSQASNVLAEEMPAPTTMQTPDVFKGLHNVIECEDQFYLNNPEKRPLVLIIDSNPYKINEDFEINPNGIQDSYEILPNHSGFHALSVLNKEPCSELKHLNAEFEGMEKKVEYNQKIIEKIRKFVEDNPGRPIIISSSILNANNLVTAKELDALSPGANIDNFTKSPHREIILEKLKEIDLDHENGEVPSFAYMDIMLFTRIKEEFGDAVQIMMSIGDGTKINLHGLNPETYLVGSESDQKKPYSSQAQYTAKGKINISAIKDPETNKVIGFDFNQDGKADTLVPEGDSANTLIGKEFSKQLLITDQELSWLQIIQRNDKNSNEFLSLKEFFSNENELDENGKSNISDDQLYERVIFCLQGKLLDKKQFYAAYNLHPVLAQHDGSLREVSEIYKGNQISFGFRSYETGMNSMLTRVIYGSSFAKPVKKFSEKFYPDNRSPVRNF